MSTKKPLNFPSNDPGNKYLIGNGDLFYEQNTWNQLQPES